jgi:transposase-like protein
MMNKTPEKDASIKLTRKRMNVIEMAEALGNISESCRRGGMDRTSFYEWKRRFQTHGIEGLIDLPPIPKSQPNTTSPENEARVIKEKVWLTHPGVASSFQINSS